MVCCLPACDLMQWWSSTLSWCDGAGGESEVNLGKFLLRIVCLIHGGSRTFVGTT